MTSVELVESVISQHCEEAAFLWTLRNASVHEPHYSLRDLKELDDRVAGHIDGLRIAGESAWEVVSAALENGESGEVFAAAVLALISEDGRRLDRVLEVAQKETDSFGGLAAALGWIPSQCLDNWIEAFSRSRAVGYRRLLVIGLAINRARPGDLLKRAVMDSDATVRARALRAAGELRIYDLVAELRRSLNGEDAECRFWAAWSLVLLGDDSALGPLKAFVNFDSKHDFTQRALQLALRSMPLDSSHNWLQGLAQEESHLREVLIGCGVTGDPLYVPWLIRHMSQPPLARVAGESFSMITGVDLAYDDLDGDWPPGFEAGPTEDPADEKVEMDQDEDLPWPDPDKLSDWWSRNSGRFQKGARYLCGRPIDIDSCQCVLRAGFQRQRTAAAYELALLQPNKPLFETRAPGFRQQEWLGVSQSRVPQTSNQEIS